jgi:Mrp family chromosome partitioning ATPase
MRPNDLRHYLNQRLAASAAESAKDIEKPAKAVKSGNGKTGPVLKSLDAVLNHILAPGKGVAPRAVLVAGATPQVDATQEAIQIARGLVARREQIVLLDLTRGAAAVSGPLGLPRAPGFTDLAAGRASFEDVVRIDSDSPLQVIAAGNPAIKPDGEETDSFMRVFEALTHVYDCVVIHADRDVMRKLRPALKFELPAAVAVLPAGTAMKGADTVELTDFTSLGCPVVVYEQNGKEPRSGLFGRLAAG